MPFSTCGSDQRCRLHIERKQTTRATPLGASTETIEPVYSENFSIHDTRGLSTPGTCFGYMSWRRVQHFESVASCSRRNSGTAARLPVRQSKLTALSVGPGVILGGNNSRDDSLPRVVRLCPREELDPPPIFTLHPQVLVLPLCPHLGTVFSSSSFDTPNFGPRSLL
jgi:hypothetical protein